MPNRASRAVLYEVHRRYTASAGMRERFAAALDEAERGVPVIIERKGVQYRGPGRGLERHSGGRPAPFDTLRATRAESRGVACGMVRPKPDTTYKELLCVSVSLWPVGVKDWVSFCSTPRTSAPRDPRKNEPVP
jgi:hypothetical protein